MTGRCARSLGDKIEVHQKFIIIEDVVSLRMLEHKSRGCTFPHTAQGLVTRCAQVIAVVAQYVKAHATDFC